jgi:hypothetical protein
LSESSSVILRKRFSVRFVIGGTPLMSDLDSSSASILDAPSWAKRREPASPLTADIADAFPLVIKLLVRLVYASSSRSDISDSDSSLLLRL